MRLLSLLALGLLGCGSDPAPSKDAPAPAPAADAPPPVFTLAWSEYPSWSTFGVAHELGLLNGKKGELGEIEKKWKVDVVLKEADYDSCITMYGAGQVDAAALTNMDALPPAATKNTVAILPTSTSAGADALITTKDITDITQLKGKKVYGLALTVSEYTFVRNLEMKGEKEKDYSFTNMDPAAAALAMQQKNDGYEAIVVWNPFVLETLNKRDDVHVLADSTAIPGEIVDMVIASEASLAKPGGDAFAHAVIDAFYAVSARIEDKATRKDTLVALGEKFSHLDAKAMKTVVKQTAFYKTADDGIALFEGEDLKKVMKTVVAFETSHGMLDAEPKIAYGSEEGAQLRFDASYMKAVKASK